MSSMHQRRFVTHYNCEVFFFGVFFGFILVGIFTSVLRYQKLIITR